MNVYTSPSNQHTWKTVMPYVYAQLSVCCWTSLWERVNSRVTSPPHSNTGGFHLVFSVPFSYFIFIFYLPRCTQPDFASVFTLASLQFLSCCHHNNNKKLFVCRWTSWKPLTAVNTLAEWQYLRFYTLWSRSFPGALKHVSSCPNFFWPDLGCDTRRDLFLIFF